MKLPSLLSQYLREQKTLSLPGIGVFNLTGPVVTSDDHTTHSSNIQFQIKKIKEPDEKLINFIKQETGKIKPLAIADLETFIATGMELLAMGKPFELEGIGRIQKQKNGEFEFIAGEVISVKHEPALADEKKMSVFEDSKYEPKSNPLQKLLAVGLLLAGLGVVLLGGYYLYNRSNNFSSHEDDHLSSPPIQQPIVDSAALKPDTLVSVMKEPESYRFVLETKNNKAAAVKRYKQLKQLPTDIRMETTDSMNYKLFFILPATARDTARIKDSLSNFYGKKIRIE